MCSAPVELPAAVAAGVFIEPGGGSRRNPFGHLGLLDRGQDAVTNRTASERSRFGEQVELLEDLDSLLRWISRSDECPAHQRAVAEKRPVARKENPVRLGAQRDQLGVVGGGIVQDVEPEKPEPSREFPKMNVGHKAEWGVRFRIRCRAKDERSEAGIRGDAIAASESIPECGDLAISCNQEDLDVWYSVRFDGVLERRRDVEAEDKRCLASPDWEEVVEVSITSDLRRSAFGSRHRFASGAQCAEGCYHGTRGTRQDMTDAFPGAKPRFAWRPMSWGTRQDMTDAFLGAKLRFARE